MIKLVWIQNFLITTFRVFFFNNVKYSFKDHEHYLLLSPNLTFGCQLYKQMALKNINFLFCSFIVHGLQCYGCNVIHGQKYVDVGCTKPEVITCTHSHKGFKHRFCIKTESSEYCLRIMICFSPLEFNLSGQKCVTAWENGDVCRTFSTVPDYC